MSKKLPDKTPERVVYLTLTTWAESSCVPWAKHWYGKLERCHEIMRVYCVLTEKDAKRLNEDDGENDPTAWPYKAGEQSGRFFSRDAVIKAALDCWQKQWPDADILILGDPLTLDPQEVLAGPEPLKSDINAIVERCHSSGYYDALQLTDEHKVLRRDWLLLWEGSKQTGRRGQKHGHRKARGA